MLSACHMMCREKTHSLHYGHVCQQTDVQAFSHHQCLLASHAWHCTSLICARTRGGQTLVSNKSALQCGCNPKPPCLHLNEKDSCKLYCSYLGWPCKEKHCTLQKFQKKKMDMDEQVGVEFNSLNGRQLKKQLSKFVYVS